MSYTLRLKLVRYLILINVIKISSSDNTAARVESSMRRGLDANTC
jgi:hypothetical protein